MTKNLRVVTPGELTFHGRSWIRFVVETGSTNLLISAAQFGISVMGKKWGWLTLGLLLTTNCYNKSNGILKVGINSDYAVKLEMGLLRKMAAATKCVRLSFLKAR